MVWQISFVFDNIWYTLVGDNQSVEALAIILDKSELTIEKHLTSISHVGDR